MGMTSLDKETWLKPRRRARAPTAFSCSDHLEKQDRSSDLFTHSTSKTKPVERKRGQTSFLIKHLWRGAAHVYECRRRTARLVIPRDRTPLRSRSTWSKSSSLHTSRESPVLPEGRTHKRSLSITRELILPLMEQTYCPLLR